MNRTQPTFARAWSSTFAVALLACALMQPAQAATKRKHRHAESARASRMQQLHRGSEESRSERERRLARECKGRPNAGACLGFGG